MAFSTNEIQVTWSSANTISVAAAGTANSDDITFSASAVYAEIMVKTDNSGTPADGDTLDVYLQKKSDPDADSTDDYETTGSFLVQLDTYDSDPAVRVISIPVGFNGRIHVENNGASAMTVSAKVIEKLSS